MAKDIIYGEDARKALQTGIDKLARSEEHTSELSHITNS